MRRLRHLTAPGNYFLYPENFSIPFYLSESTRFLQRFRPLISWRVDTNECTGDVSWLNAVTSRGYSLSFCFDFITMTEAATSTDIQQSTVSNPNETPSLTTTDHLPLDSSDSDEPPTKKSKTTSPDKPRLLEERLGSILSCCICLDLSTLAMFQVNTSLSHDDLCISLSAVCQWTSDVCVMLQSSTSRL